MKFLRLLFLGLTLPFVALSQANYKPGYVLKLNGDTLKGYINYREWDITPGSVEFKSSVADKQPVKFFPATIRGFDVTGLDTYLTYIGPVSMDKNVFPDVASEYDTSVATDTVFLQFKYKGTPVSLLEQEDGLKPRFFVMEDGQAPIELKYYRYLAGDNSTSIRTLETYKQQLALLAQKYNSTNTTLMSYIERTNFNSSSLRDVIKQINNDKRKSSSLSTRLFVGLALNRYDSRFEGLSLFANRPSVDYSPRLSVGADLFRNAQTQKFFFRAELSFTRVKTRFYDSDLSPFLLTVNEYKFNFEQYNITLTPQFIYNFYNKESLKVFLGVGANVNYSFYANNKYTSRGTVTPNYYTLEKLWSNFPVQVGVTLNKKLDIFAEYTHPAAFTNYNFFSVSNRVFGIGVHYHFSKKF
jgi:hypothetical protein